MVELWEWINQNFHTDRIFEAFLILYFSIQILYIIPNKIQEMQKEIEKLKKKVE